MTVQLLTPAGSVRRNGERAPVDVPGLAESDLDGSPFPPPSDPTADETGALAPYVEDEPGDDDNDPGWLARGGMLLAATSALTVGAAAAATTVEDAETDALAPPEPAVAEPAPPFTDDAGEEGVGTGTLVPVIPPEMLAATAPAAASAAPVAPAPAPAPAVEPRAAASTPVDPQAALAAEAVAAEEAAAAEAAAAERAAADRAAATPAAATPAPAGTATQPEPRYVQVAAAAPTSGSFDSSVEREFTALTNQARAAAGAPAVVRDATLDSYARAHAAQMVQAGSIHHSDISSLLGPFNTVGENVGTGPATTNIQAALTNSPTHYANMVEAAFTSMGVGAVVDNAGMIWTVHVYGA